MPIVEEEKSARKSLPLRPSWQWRDTLHEHRLKPRHGFTYLRKQAHFTNRQPYTTRTQINYQKCNNVILIPRERERRPPREGIVGAASASEHDDLLDPFPEFGYSRVDARLVGQRAADAPRDHARKVPHAVALDHQRAARVALQGEGQLEDVAGEGW